MNPNIVKVVRDCQKKALYFSRSRIPWISPDEQLSAPIRFLKHIGIYGYKASMLSNYLNFDKSPYEVYENLEQLRFIWNKIRIHCIKVKVNNSISINSLNDLKLAKETIK